MENQNSYALLANNVIDSIFSQINQIQDKIDELIAQSKPQPKEFLTVKELSQFLGRTEGAVYSLVNRNEIPFAKTGKKLLFKRTEIESWIASHKRLSKLEIKQLAKECA